MNVSLKLLFVWPLAVVTLSGDPGARGGELVHLTPGLAVTRSITSGHTGALYSIVGNPKIADITFGPKNTLIMLGKIDGVTNLVVMDQESGEYVYAATLAVGSGTRVSVRVYSGTPESEGYLCSRSDCVPSGVLTAKEEGEPQGQSTVSTESK